MLGVMDSGGAITNGMRAQVSNTADQFVNVAVEVERSRGMEPA